MSHACMSLENGREYAQTADWRGCFICIQPSTGVLPPGDGMLWQQDAWRLGVERKWHAVAFAITLYILRCTNTCSVGPTFDLPGV